VPKLWIETIEEHRRTVHEAILSATMSQIAEKTGTGRATLYKYFPDVEAIPVAHHDQHVTGHLQQLAYCATGQRREPAAGSGTRALCAHLPPPRSPRH
jgi:AcrR family transcriptional regulator